MNKKAITLVELIISVTISILLMASIGVFMSSGMQNLFLQQSYLDNISEIHNFNNEIQKTFREKNASGSITKVASGIVFKREKAFDVGGFSYIGTSQENKFFCKDDNSEDTKTNHAFIKSFIPFFQDGKYSFTGKVNHNGKIYTSHQKEHKITDASGKIIVGRGVFGNRLKDGDFGTGVYLNSPTGMASDGEMLYISDTLNNRVIYISGDKVYTLLDEDDGLNEPTGLYFDETEKDLYIANSGAGEILKVSAKKYTSTEEIPFPITPYSNVNNISKMVLHFTNNYGATNMILPNNVSSLSFDWSVKKEDYLVQSGNSLIYYFSDYSKVLETENYNCSATSNTLSPAFIDEDGKVKKIRKTCNRVQTGTDSNSQPIMVWRGIQTTYGSQNNVSLNSGTEHIIKISGIQITNDSQPGNYYVGVRFYNEEGDELYRENMHFLTIGDDKIYTMQVNTLQIHKENLTYPNGIWGQGNNDFHQFTSSSPYNYTIDKNYDTILKAPIKSMEVSKTSNLLNFVLQYYRNYNCYNLDENTQKVKTFLIKKNINE